MKKFASLKFALILSISTFLLTINSACNFKEKSKALGQTSDVNKRITQIKGSDLDALASFTDTSQIKRYQSEIDLFVQDDSLNPYREIDILFTGSSSIRKWKTLEADMKGYRVINRGFGGSTIPEVIFYSDILIFKHKPSKIVFYAGDNDISNPTGDTAKVIASFKYFQRLVNQNLTQTQLYFISIKPSPSRIEYWPQMLLINNKIEQFCKSTDNCTFIDITKAMFDKNDNIRKEIFEPDMLHLNKAGYAIWTNIILNSIKTQNK